MSAPRDAIAGMGRGMLVVFWLLVLGGLTWIFSGVLASRENPNAAVEGTFGDGVAEIRLLRNAGGHYVAEGTIEGEPVPMLLDTGATSVVVPLDIAERIGLEKGPRIPVVTANGRTRVWTTRIDRLRLGTLEFRDLDAAIAPGLEGAVLLGMSALGDLELTQRGGELVIRQHRG